MFDYKKHFLYLGGGGGAEPEPETPNLPTPVTTKEQYLYAKVTGGDTSNLPTPVTTEEQYLYAMAQSGGGGGGGVSAVTLYPDMTAETVMLYKDEALTQGFATAEEAISFIEDNPLIRIKKEDGGFVTYDIPVTYLYGESDGVFSVVVLTSQDNYRLFVDEPGQH